MLLDESYLNEKKMIATFYGSVRSVSLWTLLTLMVIIGINFKSNQTLLALAATSVVIAFVCGIYQILRIMTARSKKTLDVLK